MILLQSTFLVLAFFGFYASAQKTYNCDFENGLCSFLSNDKSNRENWKIGRGKLNADDTGPTTDHTLGNANGSYLFVNLTAAKMYDVKLQTLILTGNYCVQFFYHMYGADVGKLTVQAQSVSDTYESKDYFFRSGTQGDRWKEAVFSVYRSASMRYRGYKIIFFAKQSSLSNFRGDIALDDIKMTPGKCPDTIKEADKLCSFDDYNCGYIMTSKSGSAAWEWIGVSENVRYFESTPTKDHTLGTEAGGFWFSGTESTRDLEITNLRSPRYNPPEQSLNCLHFYYYMDADKEEPGWLLNRIVKVANFLVSAIVLPNDRTLLVSKTKTATNSRQWTHVKAEVNLTKKYQFVFTTEIDTEVECVIALDDVQLFPGNCPEADFCDFEEDKCSWVDGEGDFNWLRKSGNSKVNRITGPLTDRTLGTGNGHYIVINTVGGKAGSKANLESEVMPPSEETTCLSFYFYISGNDVGTLEVIQKEQAITEATIWRMKNESVDSWRRAAAPLGKSNYNSKLVLRSITGTGKEGFMAVDDIRIRKGEKCDIIPPQADPLYEDPTTYSATPTDATEISHPFTYSTTESPTDSTEIFHPFTDESTEQPSDPTEISHPSIDPSTEPVTDRTEISYPSTDPSTELVTDRTEISFATTEPPPTPTEKPRVFSLKILLKLSMDFLLRRR